MFGLLVLLPLLISPLVTTSAQVERPFFILTPQSQVYQEPTVLVVPLYSDDDAKRNQFRFGQRTEVTLESSLSVPIPQGATIQAWLSELSSGNVARIAANQFMPNTDLCSTLSRLDDRTVKQLNLPKQCPIEARRSFVFDQVLDTEFWKGVDKYKEYVVGATGVLELRLFDKAPCSVCWQKPRLLVGVSIPFEIVDDVKKKMKEDSKKKKKDNKKRRHTEL